MSESQVSVKALKTSEARHFSPEQLADLNKLLSQLGPEEIQVTLDQLVYAVHNSFVVVATELVDGRDSVVGFTSLDTTVSITGGGGFIPHLVVAQSKRRRRIATALHDLVLHEARRLRLRRIDLTCGPTRVAARNFWRQQGYVERNSAPFRLELTYEP